MVVFRQQWEKYGLILMLMVNVSLLWAQSTPKSHADITGYIKDSSSGEALPFANVMLKGTLRGTNTNSDGYFVLVDVPWGHQTLIVRYIGYKSKEVDLKVEAAAAPALRIDLESTLLQVEGVTVTAQAEMLQANKQVSQMTFSPRQIASLPSIGEVDIFRAMQMLPGISGIGDGSSGLYVRGGTPDQNLTLFDGMTIYHVDHFFGFFSAFNADAVKDIQIYKGGFPAAYGGRLSSVVNLTGKTGHQSKMRFGYGVNLLSGNAYFETPLSHWGSFIIAGRRSYTDFIRSPLYDRIYKLMTGESNGGAVGGPVRGGDFGGGGPGGGRFGNQQAAEFQPSFYFYDLNSKLTLTPSSKDILSLSLYSGKDNLDKSQDYSDMGLNFRDTNTSATLKTNDFTRWGNLGFSGKWSRQWQNRFHMDLLAARSRYFSEYDRSSSLSGTDTPPPSSGTGDNMRRSFANATKEDNHVTDITLKSDFDWQITSGHTLGFGSQLTNFKNSYGASRDDSVQIFRRDNSAQLRALYLQDTWKYKIVQLTLGLRSSHYDKTGKWYQEPRADFSLALTSKLSLKGAWGHYYQFVNQIANEDVTQGARDFWLLADADFNPGFADHQILGLAYENANWLFSVEGYHKNLQDLIEFSRRFVMRGGRGPGMRVDNFFVGDGKADGVEFLIQKKFGRLTGWIGYTLSNVDYTFPAMNNGAAFAADHDQPHRVNLVGKYTMGVYSFSATWVFASGTPYTAPESQYFIPMLDGQVNSYIHVSDKNGYRLPDYHRLDISASRKYESEHWETNVGISLFNLYNRKNVWYRDYNLDTTPVTITNVLYLGFTPTIFVQMNLK